MNKFLTLLFCLILLLAPIAGCLDDTPPEDDTIPEDDTTPEDDTSPTTPDVNETDDNSGGGSDSGGDNGGSGGDTSPNTPDVNETDDNSGGGSDTSGDNGDSGDNTDNSNQNETDDNSGGGETEPDDNSGGGETEPDNGDDITVGNTTECNTGETGFAFSVIQFDITNHPDLVNIGGLEIECSSNILYGFAWDNVAEVEHFISIDPSNGLVASL
jgi:hypothetical protein